MKKLLIILSIASLLCACSAQQRLARLLANHPELKAVDTLTIRDTIILQPSTQTTTTTLQDIIAMDSVATAAMNDSASENDSSVPTSIRIDGDHSSASLTALGNGQYTLSVEQKGDTVYLEKKVEVPVYKTKTEYKDKIVYKMRWYQETFCWIGFFFTMAIIIIIILKFVA